jgi:hypothetical protein
MIRVLDLRKDHKILLRCGVLGLAALVTTPLFGQERTAATGVPYGGTPPSLAGVPWDWSHQHVIFSAPANAEQAAKLQQEPRYWHQWYHRNALAGVPGSAQAPSAGTDSSAATSTKQKIQKDWSEAITSGGIAATLTGLVGALGSSSIGSASSLTVDGVTFRTSPPTSETATITFSGFSKPANTSSVTIGTVTYTFETSSFGTAPATGCEVYSATGSTGATSLYQAITYTGTQGSTNYRCASSITAANSAVTASRSSSTVSLTAATAGSTGFTFSEGGSTNFSTFSHTAGTNGTTSGTTFAYWSGATYVSSSTVATNIATVLNANATVSAVLTAAANTPAAGDVTFTAKVAGVSGNGYEVTASSFSAFSPASAYLSGGAAGVQPNMYPAKYSFSTTSASCSDFVVYPTGAAGAANAANLVAYSNLYTGGCSGTVPAVSWAYNTGGTVTTSPILSEDGTQIAFMQVSGTTASLVLLKWSASGGSISAPSTPAAQASGSSYRSCTAPCYYALSLGANDTLSSPFYDYLRDALYVGDDSGNLHQFFGAFNGDPAENTASPWPVHLGANKLSSPVYDSETGFEAGYVFVGDMGGVFYSVGSGYGGTTSGTIYGNTGSLGQAIADAPLVDSPQGVEYVFVTTNGSYSWTGYDAVWEFVSIFTTLLPPGNSGAPGVVQVGVGGTGYYLYAGAFDNVYFQSSPPSYAATGNLYVVGNTGTAGGGALYQVPISLSALTGASNQVATGLNSTERPWPSPATEFCNGACTSNGTETTSGTDYLFFSVNRGAKTGCTNGAGNGCILSYNISNPASVSQAGSGLNVATPGTNGCWATGGIIIDNSSTASGASEIYFANFNGNTAGGPTGATSSNCTAGSSANIDAVQAAQSGP